MPAPARTAARIVPGLILCLLAILALTARKFLDTGAFGPAGVIDFHVFHLVGQMIHDGRLLDAYDAQAFAAAQAGIVNDGHLMLWSYPPQFDLIAAALALVPVWLGYVLFVGGTLAAYLAVLRRIAGDMFGLALIAAFPFLLVTILAGQNGFLTGALGGLFCLWALRPGGRAGVPLGLMIVKPHLAVGLSLMAMISGRRTVIATAAVTVAVTSGVATLAFGLAVWPAFVGAMGQSGEYLSSGAFPLFRMTSVHALCLSLGLPSGTALGVHAGVAALALAAVIGAQAQGWSMRRKAAVAAMASLLVSPYGYDYDMGLFFVALALALPDLIRHATRVETTALVLAGWVASGTGLVVAFAGLASSRPAAVAVCGTALGLMLILRVTARAVAGGPAVPELATA